MGAGRTRGASALAASSAARALALLDEHERSGVAVLELLRPCALGVARAEAGEVLLGHRGQTVDLRRDVVRIAVLGHDGDERGRSIVVVGLDCRPEREVHVGGDTLGHGGIRGDLQAETPILDVVEDLVHAVEMTAREGPPTGVRSRHGPSTGEPEPQERVGVEGRGEPFDARGGIPHRLRVRALRAQSQLGGQQQQARAALDPMGGGEECVLRLGVREQEEAAVLVEHQPVGFLEPAELEQVVELLRHTALLARPPQRGLGRPATVVRRQEVVDRTPGRGRPDEVALPGLVVHVELAQRRRLEALEVGGDGSACALLAVESSEQLQREAAITGGRPDQLSEGTVGESIPPRRDMLEESPLEREGQARPDVVAMAALQSV